MSGITITNQEIREIRKSLKLTQANFALLLGVSLKLIQDWEQGKRNPVTAARVLLRVVEKYPEAVAFANGLKDWKTIQRK